MQTWADVLTQSFQAVWTNFVLFVPTLFFAILFVIIGWLVGSVAGRLTKQVMDSLKIDNALKSTGLDEVAARGGFKLSAGGFLGWLVKWFVIVVFLVTALEILGLSQVTAFLYGTVLLFLPRVIVAVLILLIAAVLAEFVRDVVVGTARTAQIKGAKFLGAMAKWSIWVFALLAALVQIGIATSFLQTLFGGIVVALSLAFGLAFGLGGKDTAARILEKLEKEINDK